MGQLDSVNQAATDTPKFNLSGIHFHDVPTNQPPASPVGGGKIDLHSIVSGTGEGNLPAAAAPAATRQTEAQPPPPVTPRLPVAIAASPTSYPTYQPPRPGTQVADVPEPRPPHPPDSASTGEQMGSLITTGVALGATVLAGNALKKSVRDDEIARITRLREVTNPETLEAVKIQADLTTRMVAAKVREADAAVEKLALLKPEAFQEVRETMPAKGPGKPMEELVYHVPKPPRALTKEELALPAAQQEEISKSLALSDAEQEIADRAVYLRTAEKTLVNGFNIGNTSTVSAFRTRKPYIDGLGSTEAARFEGLDAPFNKLESLSDTLMEQTTTGRLAMHSAASGDIFKGIGMLAGSFLATRGIDHLIYGDKSQSYLTTAFDCGAPFLVLTKMSPVAKIALMIGGHELVRGIEYLTEKNRDKQ